MTLGPCGVIEGPKGVQFIGQISCDQLKGMMTLGPYGVIEGQRGFRYTAVTVDVWCGSEGGRWVSFLK